MDQQQLIIYAQQVAHYLFEHASVDDVLSVLAVSTNEAHEILDALRDAEVTI